MGAVSRLQSYATDVASSAGSAHRPLLSVIVPTFNERNNVGALTDRLRDALAGVAYEIVFVDDSTDDTPEVIARLQHDAPIRVIHREGHARAGGLTTALTSGLRAARGRYAAVIDADLQHPPERLRDLLDAARLSGAEVAVASRYRSGGSAAGLASPARRAISVASKWVSKALFYERLSKISDPGSGFFLLNRAVIDGVELRPIGYKMLTEILVRGRWGRCVEIPYRFAPRIEGCSKAGLRQGVEYLRHTARLFLEVPYVGRAWKFAAVGVTGVVVNLTLLWIGASLLGLPPHAAWAAGVEASVLSNYCLNRTLTWRDRRAPGPLGWLRQALRYHASSLAGIVANLFAFSVASAVGASTLSSGVVGVVCGMSANFVAAARIVFPSPPADRPTRVPASIDSSLEGDGDLAMERAA